MTISCCAAPARYDAAASVPSSLTAYTSSNSDGCSSDSVPCRSTSIPCSSSSVSWNSSSNDTLPRFRLKRFYQSPAASAISVCCSAAVADCPSAAGAAARRGPGAPASPAGAACATTAAPAAPTIPAAAAGPAEVPYFQQLTVNSDGSSVCVGSSSLSLLFFSPQHLLLQQQLPHAHFAQISCVSFFHKHPCLLASASQDASVRLWDLRCCSRSSSYQCGAAAATAARSHSQAAAAAPVAHLQLGSAGSTEAEVWAVAVNSTDTLLAAAYKNGFSLVDIRCLSSSSSPHPSFSSFSFCTSSRRPPPPHSSSVVSNSLNSVTYSSSSGSLLASRASASAASFRGSGRSPRQVAQQQQQELEQGQEQHHGRKKKRDLVQQQTQQLRTVIKRVELHAESINRLLFHPSIDWLLLSAGEDGLVCCHDVRASIAGATTAQQHKQQQQRPGATAQRVVAQEQLSESREGEEGGEAEAIGPKEDEDEALCCCFSYGQPIRKINIVGPQQDCVCVCSSTDEAALWQLRGFLSDSSSSRHSNTSSNSCSSAVSIERRAEWSDIRMHPHLTRGESAGYLVDNFYDASSGRFFLLGGSVDGGLLMFHANLEELLPAAVFAAPPQRGHEAVVRAACTVGETGANSGSLLLLTCGEDGRLCAWKQEGDSSLPYEVADCSGGSGSSDKRRRHDDSSSNSSNSNADVFVYRGSHQLRSGSSARFRPY